MKLTIDIDAAQYSDPVSVALNGSEISISLSNVVGDQAIEQLFTNRIEDLRDELQKANDLIEKLQFDLRFYEKETGRLRGLADDIKASFDEYRRMFPPTRDSVAAAAWEHYAAGNKINAIKRVRELTGWGLRESKEYCDGLWAGKPVMPSPAPAQYVANYIGPVNAPVPEPAPSVICVSRS